MWQKDIPQIPQNITEVILKGNRENFDIKERNIIKKNNTGFLQL